LNPNLTIFFSQPVSRPAHVTGKWTKLAQNTTSN
jgi:hypothetical protein